MLKNAMRSSETFIYCNGKCILHFRAKNRSARATLGAAVNENEICRRLRAQLLTGAVQLWTRYRNYLGCNAM